MAEVRAGPDSTVHAPADDAFRLIAESARVMFWMCDREGRCLYLNSAQKAFWNAPDDLAGFDWLQSVSAEDRAHLFSVFNQATADCAPFRIEAHYQRADGAIRVLQTDARPHFSSAGVFEGMIGVNVDVTDARLAESVLRESEERFRRLADSAPLLMWVSDTAGKRVFVNRGYVDFLGASFAEALVFDWKGRLHPEDAGRVRAESITGEASRKLFKLEARYQRADGAWRWLQSHSQPRWSATGELDGFIGVAFDVTEAREWAEAQSRVQHALESRVIERTREVEESNRRLEAEYQERLRAERLAKENAQHFRRLVNSVVDYAIYMLDAEGNVATWNAGAERIKGYSAEEIVGKHFSIFYTPEDIAAGTPAKVLERAAAAGRFEIEDWRVRKNGERFWSSVIVDPILDDDGKLIGFAKVTRDISDRLEVQQALEQAREALFQSQKMDAVGQLTGGLAHDFNNMLAGVVGGLELLRRRIEAGKFNETQKYLDAAMTSANRAAALTARLLAFGRRQALDVRPVDVNRVIASMSDLLRRTMGERITISVDAPVDSLMAMTDEHQLESALLNLAINARDAMPNGGALSIGARLLDMPASVGVEGLAEGRYVCLKVADTGQGMSADVLSKAFEPFFTTKPIGHGTGLGLSMIYGFAKQISGAVRIESVEGKGTTVLLFMPATTHQEEIIANNPPGASRGAGETVLVVEDDPSVRILVTDILGDLGYDVVVAQDASTALPIIEGAGHIDLLVSDVGLPGGMNGRQIAEIARQHRPNLRVLLMTGYAEAAALDRSPTGSGVNWIAKPFQVDDFAAKVNAVLGDNVRQ